MLREVHLFKFLGILNYFPWFSVAVNYKTARKRCLTVPEVIFALKH